MLFSVDACMSAAMSSHHILIELLGNVEVGHPDQITAVLEDRKQQGQRVNYSATRFSLIHTNNISHAKINTDLHIKKNIFREVAHLKFACDKRQL